MSAADGIGADLGQPDMSHVSGVDHVFDRADRVLDRHPRVEPGRAVHVDMVGAKALQRVRQRGLHRGGAAVETQKRPVRRALATELHADLHRVAVTSTQCVGEQHLVVAHAVEVAGVEQGDAGIERGVNGGNAFGAVAGAIRVAHRHQAESERRRRPQGAKVLGVHGISMRRGRHDDERPVEPGIEDPWHSSGSGPKMA